MEQRENSRVTDKIQTLTPLFTPSFLGERSK